MYMQFVMTLLQHMGHMLEIDVWKYEIITEFVTFKKIYDSNAFQFVLTVQKTVQWPFKMKNNGTQR